ncbi:MAG: OsmC family protein [Bacteroidota bacterium]
MVKIQATYDGHLRTTATHLPSSNVLYTDAPTDNQGKGEAFSPTDLVATACLSCMITSMGIVAQNNDLALGTVSGEVEKIMSPAPRRISRLQIELIFEGHNLSDTDKTLLENAALSCPVTRSLHPDTIVNLKFRYE